MADLSRGPRGRGSGSDDDTPCSLGPSFTAAAVDHFGESEQAVPGWICLSRGRRRLDSSLMRWNWLFLLQLAVATAVWQERASR